MLFDLFVHLPASTATAPLATALFVKGAVATTAFLRLCELALWVIYASLQTSLDPGPHGFVLFTSSALSVADLLAFILHNI